MDPVRKILIYNLIYYPDWMDIDSNEIADEFIKQNSRCDHKTYFVVEMGGCEL